MNGIRDAINSAVKNIRSDNELWLEIVSRALVKLNDYFLPDANNICTGSRALKEKIKKKVKQNNKTKENEPMVHSCQ